MVTVQEVGEGLYGKRWASDLGRDLGLTPGTVTLWSKRTTRLKKSSLLALKDLISSRVKELHELSNRLDQDIKESDDER